MLAAIISEGAHQNNSIVMIFDAPTIPLLKLMDEMIGTFFLHQYIIATAKIWQILKHFARSFH